MENVGWREEEWENGQHKKMEFWLLDPVSFDCGQGRGDWVVEECSKSELFVEAGRWTFAFAAEAELGIEGLRVNSF